MESVLGARLLLLLAVAAAALPPAAAAYSSLWGKEGELWDPAGPLPDFSFAGYKQGNEELPRPPSTRSVTEFRPPGSNLSDTEMIKAALDWAHAQPLTDGYIVLTLPPGRFELGERVHLKRSRLVLRGAGRTRTRLYVPHSLTDLYGPSHEGAGGYVHFGGIVTIGGAEPRRDVAAMVVADAAKGSKTVQVNDTSALTVGQYYALHMKDVNGKFNNAMFDNLVEAPDRYVNRTRTKFTTRVMGIQGQTVTLERHLPYAIAEGVNSVTLVPRDPDVTHDTGVEGLTFEFKWEWYAGHHLERGWNAIEFSYAYDCWARNIGTVNADNGILVNDATAVTVEGLKMQVSRTRRNSIPNKYGEDTDSDGHWGVQYATASDVLVKQFDIRCKMMHDLGTGSSGKFGVIMSGRMKDGNLDLHRALAGPTLYTDIDVGLGGNALYSGGPDASGPNAVAGTTWWGIRSAQPVDPPQSKLRAGDCAFGPALNLVNVDIKREEEALMCATWHYEREVEGPTNLYYAQLARRRKLERQAALLEGAAPGAAPAPVAAAPAAAPAPA